MSTTLSPPKNCPHRANGEGKTNSDDNRTLVPVLSPVKLLDFMRRPSLATFTRAFPFLPGICSEHNGISPNEKPYE
jgi:hypothetical protein